MFIRRKTYQALVDRIETLENQNKERAVETRQNAERYHRLCREIDHTGKMWLPVHGGDGDMEFVPIFEVIEGMAKHLGMGLSLHKADEYIRIEDEMIDLVFELKDKPEDAEDS